MKKLIFSLLLILSSLTYAQDCVSLDMNSERETLENLNHIPKPMKEEILSLKRKVKQAQVYGCVDKLLSGTPMALDQEERDIALNYLKMLTGVSQSQSEKEQIAFAIEEIERI